MTTEADPARWGVAGGYHDYAGRWIQPPATTIEAVLCSMGADRADGPPAPPAVTVRTDHQLPPLGPGRIVLEDGGEVDADHPGPDLPTGYHRLERDGAPPRPLIVSPGRVPYPQARAWGFAAQLYATRSTRSWGIGDLADLRRLGEWSKGLGAGFTLVNPLHAATPAVSRQASPYYPGSRCFFDPIYLAVEEVPGATDVAGTEQAAAAGRALNRDRRIDRDRVWAQKSQALQQIFATSPGDGLEAYRLRRGEALERFATYCALAEVHGGDWTAWPADVEPDPSRVSFHAWLQWRTEEQVAAADAALGLVADLAVGVDPHGPDTWIWRDCFAGGMRVGAPPDEFNTRGQDWGLPPFDPWRVRVAGYAPWIEMLRSNMRHGAGLRVDHVMGLFRLFWIPDGEAPPAGTYVRYPHHDLLNILALEAERAGTYVVGEDLGTVEDEVRRDLAERRVLSYRLWWFEEGPPSTWPEAAMGAVTTHDLPTVAGVLTGSDLQAQREIGTLPNEDASAALLRKIEAVAGPERTTEAAIADVYRDLAAAPCVLLTATLEDALAVQERPNMPGTTDQWPNWSVALPQPLEDLEKGVLPGRLAEMLNRS